MTTLMAKENTPGKNAAECCRGGSRPKRTENARGFDQRRQFEGRSGAQRGRHPRRTPQLSFTEIRDDGAAKPPWCRAATPPPCRPARKPRSALVPAVLTDLGRLGQVAQ